MRTMSGLIRCAAGLLLVAGAAHAQATKEQATLAAQMRGAKHVALGDAIAAATTSGKPISARYEYEDKKLKLWSSSRKTAPFPKSFSIT